MKTYVYTYAALNQLISINILKNIKIYFENSFNHYEIR